MIAEVIKKNKKEKEIIIIKHMLRDESNKSVELFIWKIKELCCELNWIALGTTNTTTTAASTFN